MNVREYVNAKGIKAVINYADRNPNNVRRSHHE